MTGRRTPTGRACSPDAPSRKLRAILGEARSSAFLAAPGGREALAAALAMEKRGRRRASPDAWWFALTAARTSRAIAERIANPAGILEDALGVGEGERSGEAYVFVPERVAIRPDATGLMCPVSRLGLGRVVALIRRTRELEPGVFWRVLDLACDRAIAEDSLRRRGRPTTREAIDDATHAIRDARRAW